MVTQIAGEACAEMELDGVLLHIIEYCAPSRVICCGQAARAAVIRWQDAHPETVIRYLVPSSAVDSIPRDETFDLVVMSGCLEQLSKADSELLLGQLRNSVSPQIIVHMAGDGPLGFGDFIALGFKRWESETLKPDTGCIYTYDIASYNHKRQWNTPENWANPENWDKYRW